MTRRTRYPIAVQLDTCVLVADGDNSASVDAVKIDTSYRLTRSRTAAQRALRLLRWGGCSTGQVVTSANSEKCPNKNRETIHCKRHFCLVMSPVIYIGVASDWRFRASGAGGVFRAYSFSGTGILR